MGSAPNILHFEAPSTLITSFKMGTNEEPLSLQDNIHTSGPQSVVRLYDRDGKHCGLVFGPSTASSTNAHNPPAFIAISTHSETERAYRGPDRIEGEIPLFDKDTYPSTGEGSGLVNVLMVSWSAGAEVAERVTVARVHAKTWEDAGPVKRLIRLG